jgi:hypothetical protein
MSNSTANSMNFAYLPVHKTRGGSSGEIQMSDINRGFAIIVGVSSYEDEMSPLPYARNDAIRIYQILTQYGGFNPDRAFLFIDELEPNENVARGPSTRANILQAIQHVADIAKDGDLVLFCFAGHGGEISKTPYLLTSDTKFNVISETAIDVNKLNEILEKSKANSIVRIFDACRNPFQIGRALTGRMTQGLQDAFMLKATGWATFSSCSTGEVAHESPEFEQGVFSYYLCDGLEGKAANDSGNVTFERLVDYVKISVDNWCERQMVQQTPHLLSDLSGPLVLTTVAPAETVEPIPESHPLASLQFGLDAHFGQLPPDVRNLAFTTDEQWWEVVGLVLSIVNPMIQGFTHPTLTLSVSDAVSLQSFGQGFIKRLVTQMQKLGVAGEYRTDLAIRCSFRSSELTVPTTDLYITIVRFSVFYWIWWFHMCSSKQLEQSFTPDPPLKTGFFTLTPQAALDERKMGRVVSDILDRGSQSILDWAQQLSGSVNSRIDPLRKLGDIIE